jgi:hypothetical protein
VSTLNTRAPSSIRAIAERMAARKEEIARQMVDRYRAEIVDYHLADEDFLFRDVYSVSLDNLEALLGGLGRDGPPGDEPLESTRRGAARRVHQGISLESFLHATRLWGQITWETVLETARADVPAERDAALQIAGAVLRHVDLMSTTVAAAYLAEAEGVSGDRELVRRDLLDVLIAGRGDSERIRRLARSLRLRLRESYLVVVARGGEGEPVALRRVVDVARAHLQPRAGSLLVGMRQGEVVALYPVEEPGDVERVRGECGALAGALGQDVSVGLSGWHEGLAAIATGYAEADEAVAIAAVTGMRGHAVAFDEVLIDHMVRASPHGDRILEGTLRPLLAYDAERQSELVPTLRAYVSAGFNLTRSAEMLSVHPNTVVYRLRRIKELSGRDPHDPEDLLLLFLGLKLSELSA